MARRMNSTHAAAMSPDVTAMTTGLTMMFNSGRSDGLKKLPNRKIDPRTKETIPPAPKRLNPGAVVSA